MDEQDFLNSMQLCLIVCVSALLRHNRAVFTISFTFINMQHQQESNAAYYLYIFLHNYFDILTAKYLTHFIKMHFSASFWT